MKCACCNRKVSMSFQNKPCELCKTNYCAFHLKPKKHNCNLKYLQAECINLTKNTTDNTSIIYNNNNNNNNNKNKDDIRS